MRPQETIFLDNSTASTDRRGCQGCHNGMPFDLDFDFAFQPIVNINSRSVYAYEALVRGPRGESAYSVLSQVNATNRYQFDQACRVKAVTTAARLGMQSRLSINFLPNAVYEPAACIRSTFEACRATGFSTEQIIFEVTEGEQIEDRPHLINIFESYRRFGFVTAIDDFGAGYAGLNLLSEYQPNLVKLDMQLIRNIDQDPAKQAIVSGTVMTCRMIGSEIIAEGVETPGERDFLSRLGIQLMQGYLFGRPAFCSLEPIAASIWK